ncbi:hypothetical protein ETD83_41335 [Actinomadura soli]|uniref:Uncharacterized protein n=1 Tax=Actinomadura soli TaxID=2508997 RepID=A0A5C4IZB4_9ACTN|nr:hypothetical protein [Actinomadura soli]TMQ82259.1 hypothetical protein ETD83_41335 [Actinomadura soli]
MSWAHWAALQLGLARCHRRTSDDTQAARNAGAAFTTAALAAESGDLDAAEAAVQIGAVLVEVFTDTGEVVTGGRTGHGLAGEEPMGATARAMEPWRPPWPSTS